MVGRVCGIIEGTNLAEGSEIRRDLPRSSEIGRYWLGDRASGEGGEGGEGGGEGGEGGDGGGGQLPEAQESKP